MFLSLSFVSAMICPFFSFDSAMFLSLSFVSAIFWAICCKNWAGSVPVPFPATVALGPSPVPASSPHAPRSRLKQSFPMAKELYFVRDQWFMLFWLTVCAMHTFGRVQQVESVTILIVNRVAGKPKNFRVGLFGISLTVNRDSWSRVMVKDRPPLDKDLSSPTQG